MHYTFKFQKDIPREDQLIYNGSNPDLNTTWNVTEGKLEIAGFADEVINY